ncbi:MAG: fused MFS/spermidine synthase [FCB group bacterium]|nr:fused MFS/spermidine synthase [FCB group bacterium]
MIFPFSLFAREKVLFEKESLYHHIVVIEQDGVRYMKFGNNILQSAVYTANPLELQLEYTKYLPLSMLFNRQANRILMIGLGGGAFPRYMREYFPNMQIDVVEIDPMVAEAAKKYFYFKEDSRCKLSILDGRVFIKRSENKYDIIVLDAYNSDSIPFHLTTKEFLTEIKEDLSPGGVVAANLWSSDYDLYRAIIKTYGEVFPYLYKFRVWGKNNIVLVAGEEKFDKKEIIHRAGLLQEALKFDYDFVFAASQLDMNEVELTGVPVLTDDYAPVDKLQHMGK